ncbi:AUGMIN subunit 6-like [Phoenix dactylifera]|uniref:AUGMIN subunit 6-like n=1 Tax=Phoenix dactylifera TaxID=42345 RepID=A0A8B8ZRM1_PHODC|nr:AUGMIN subunit 6-like [Phoenix dactylifera]XP_038988862.1 AUGMIN subunit 6-like [Phoenix dactylifera]
MTAKLSSVQLEKVSTSPALKLPQLFSLAPNSLGKGMHTPKRHASATQSNQQSLPPFTKAQTDSATQDSDGYHAQKLRCSVREAALPRLSNNTEWSQEKSSDDGPEHFFMPLSTGLSRKEVDAVPNRRKQQLVFSPPEIHVSRNTKDLPSNTRSQLNSVQVKSYKLNGLDDYKKQAELLQPALGNAWSTFTDIDDILDQVFSPPLLLESCFQDTYEDLLG